MAATEQRAWFRRMREQSGALGFLSDFATITASSAASGFAATNLQRFRGTGVGRVWRSTDDTAESLLWDFGSAAALNWCCVAGPGSKGLRDVGTTAAVLTLKAGSTTSVTTTVGTLVYSPSTGGWSIDFDSASFRYWKLFIDRSGGSGVGYFQLGRVALDSAETFPTNFGDGFSEGIENLTTSYETADGGIIPRFRAPRSVLSLPFPHVGKDSGDLDVWNRFRGFAGEEASGYAPELPLYVSPDPSGERSGTEGHVAPRFCWVRNLQPFAGVGAAGRIFSSGLELVGVGR